MFLQDVTTAVEKLDKNRIVFRKSTGWLVATLVISCLIGLVYVGAHFFTREHQVDHMRDQVKENRLVIDQLELKNQILERRIVELETRVENLQEH
jgi:hypothetical protein